MNLRVKKLAPDAIIPTRGSAGAVGYDLYSADDVVVPPTHRTLISTGIAIVLPVGVYGRVAPRSGLAVKSGIQVGAGVVDPDYTDEEKGMYVTNEDCFDEMTAVGPSPPSAPEPEPELKDRILSWKWYIGLILIVVLIFIFMFIRRRRSTQIL